MSKVTFSIELNINGKVVHGNEAKEALQAYGRTLYKAAYNELERLHSRALQWAEDYDNRKKENLEPINCICASISEDGKCTIICNNAEGCEKRSCPARTLAPATWSRKWKTL